MIRFWWGVYIKDAVVTFLSFPILLSYRRLLFLFFLLLVSDKRQSPISVLRRYHAFND